MRRNGNVTTRDRIVGELVGTTTKAGLYNLMNRETEVNDSPPPREVVELFNGLSRFTVGISVGWLTGIAAAEFLSGFHPWGHEPRERDHPPQA